jgi:rod shape-determining protein MreC
VLAETGQETPQFAAGKTGQYTYIPAKIMKISNNTQHNYMIIGKGAADGVAEGAGVITGKGAVGVIDAVSEHFSYARSFKNHDMNISARLGADGAVGPLSWDGRSSAGAILKEIPHHVEFHPGDTVYTSGFSSIFPADIPLGTAGKAKIVNGATYEIEVTLFEDFAALRHVTIVDNLGRQEMTRLEEENR